MSVTAGALSKVSVQSTTASLLSAAATAGTGPYTYQWYMSADSGFVPGSPTLVAGATALAQAFTGLVPNTQLYFAVVATDTGAGNATSTSATLAVVTGQADQNQNQFAQSMLLGQTDPMGNNNVISCVVGPDEALTLRPGQAVKLVDSLGGAPKVTACVANTDECFGFIVRNQKNRGWIAGDAVEVALAGTYIYLQATSAIARGAQVCLDVTSIGGVQAINASGGENIVGWALDKAAATDYLIRVFLKSPSFAFDV